MIKSFISKNRQPKGYTARLFHSAIYIYIHISIHKPQSGDRTITQSYNGIATSHGDRFKK